jgi:hypothetical protein
MQINKLLIILIFLPFIASCAPKIKNFELYQKQFLSKSSFLPSSDQVEGKKPNVVVFAFDSNENQIALQAGISKAAASDVENLLSKNSLAKIVDRSAAKKLEKEIQLAEMNKSGAYKGPQIADYAISGVISGASFSKKYSSGSNYYDAKRKTFVSIPPSYKYRSEVSGSLKIYELPSMEVYKNIEFSGFASRSENVQQSGGFALGAMRIGGQQVSGANRDDGLVRQATLDAILTIESDLKNALAQKGYILEKRVYEKKIIFKISIGSENGLKNGDKFEIIGLFESQNPITLKTEIEQKILAKGVVTDLIDPKSAWIVLEDDKKVPFIILGDVVKMQYKKNGFVLFARKINKMLN